MKGKAKKAKLKFRPTPISRLLKAPKIPLRMVGDPVWSASGTISQVWANRERKVYAYEMERKSWPMAWKPETYDRAWEDYHIIENLTFKKWSDYHLAVGDHKVWLWNEAYANAERDNAEWDYHHENYLEEAS